MHYTKYTITTTTQAVDIISAILGELEVGGIEIEDHVTLSSEDTKGMFIDILPEQTKDDGVARVSFYIDETEVDSEKLLADFRAELDSLEGIDLGTCEISKSETEDADWQNNWKEFFHPFQVSDLIIRPTWEEAPQNMHAVHTIQIDPGTAFGTGSHDTTRLCLEALQDEIYYHVLRHEKAVREQKRGRDDFDPSCLEPPHLEVLDIGTGSGILGIAACKFGLAHVRRLDIDNNLLRTYAPIHKSVHVVGTDIDENAVQTACANRALNDITSEEFEIYKGDILTDKALQDKVGYGKYDIIVANILAPVIIELLKIIDIFMKPGGLFIMSGILEEKRMDVFAAVLENRKLQWEVRRSTREWASIQARRRTQELPRSVFI